MAVWLCRGGAHGEFEQKFIQDERVYVTWEGLDVNLGKMAERSELVDAVTKRNPEAGAKAILTWASQVWPFAHEMAVGDLVVMPLKGQRALQVGEITGAYHFEPKGPDPYFHWRPVRWVGESIPRANLAEDLRYSLGAFMTICRIKRNNAEARIRAMWKRGWKPETDSSMAGAAVPDSEEGPAPAADLEELARDQIAQLILAKFKGHGLARLVEAILEAQGYTTYRSPEGADGGVDILAGAGPLGFGAPRLCVEVKSGSDPVDRPTVDKLLGAVAKFGAQEGLFVAWGGYKQTVQKELASSYFRVRLWTQTDLLEQLLEHYDELSAELRADLPLKRVWMVATQDEE